MIVYVIAMLSNFAVFSKNYVLTLYLSDVVGCSDEQAGLVYSGVGLQFTICTLLLANVSQQLGIKTCLIISELMKGLALLTLTLSSDIRVVLCALYFLIPLSGAVGIPALKLSVKEYCSPLSRSMGFTVLFTFSHISGAFAGIFIDILSAHINNEVLYTVVFATGACIQALCVVLALCLRRKESTEHSAVDPADTLKSASLWKYLGLLFFVIFFKANFKHLDATFPKYMRRTMGDHSHLGCVLALHSIVLVIIAPLSVTLVNYYSNYSLVVLGSGISSAAGLILVLKANYLTTSLYISVLAIGESMWNPRLLDYTVDAAPAGREGFFLALVTIPYYLGIVLAGGLSGVLLENECPEGGSKHCYRVYLIIAGIGLTAVGVCSALKRCLEVTSIKRVD
jgi:predicted MFS family arabinose efflux permease